MAAKPVDQCLTVTCSVTSVGQCESETASGRVQ